MTKNNLADLYIQQGRQDEAEPLLQSVITHAHDAAGKAVLEPFRRTKCYEQPRYYLRPER